MKKITLLLGFAIVLMAGTVQLASADCGSCDGHAKKTIVKTSAKDKACASKAAFATSCAPGASNSKAGLTATGTKTCVIDGKSVECTVWSDGSCSTASGAACADKKACGPTSGAGNVQKCSHEGACTAACAPATMSKGSNCGPKSCGPGSCSSSPRKAAVKKSMARKSS